jgi:hypothetical protein
MLTQEISARQNASNYVRDYLKDLGLLTITPVEKQGKFIDWFANVIIEGFTPKNQENLKKIDMYVNELLQKKVIVEEEMDGILIK